MGVSHVSLSMSPNGDLLVYKTRGRPTTEEAEILKCSKKMKKELNRMKKKMSYESGTKILLALSIASDDMV